MRGTLGKVIEKIPSDNSQDTIYPPFREFSSEYIPDLEIVHLQGPRYK